MRTSVALWLMALLSVMSGPAAAQPSAASRGPGVHVFASGLFNASTFTFSDTWSASLYLEELRFQGRYASKTGPAFGFGATYPVLPYLSVGAAFDIVSSSPGESFDAFLPHPFFFNRPRRIEGEAAVSYDEKALHLLASYTRTEDRFVFALSGGPSYFWTSTEVVDGFSFTEDYPFDEAVLQSVSPKIYDSSKLGFNAGGWVGYRLTDQIAVGADLRFSSAKVKFTTSAGNEIEFDAGGTRIGAGVRLIF